MRTMRNYRGQAGFGLLEIMIVVGFIAILSAASYAYYNSTDHSNKVKDEVNNLTSVSGAIRGMFNSQGSFTGLTNAVILKSGSFPDRMRVPNSTTLIKHSWLTAGVTVAPATVDSTDDAFTITYASVPERACSDIVANAYRYFQLVTVNGTTITNAGLAATTCTATNTLVFRTR